jgi:acyl dehydratase
MADWTFPANKRYYGGAALVGAAEVEAYAAATNDTNPVYYGPDAAAPPMFHVKPLRDLLFALMEDPEVGLDMLHLVHASYDVEFYRSLRIGDVLHLRASQDRFEQKAKGVLTSGSLYGFVEGKPAVCARTSFFVRGQQKAPIGTVVGAWPNGEPSLMAVEERPADRNLDWKVDADQSYRYASASGDHNPIHVDPEVARSAGLSDVILQGLCTLARTAVGVVAVGGFGDPRRLRRLSARWSRPVHNGDALRTRMWRKEGDILVFEVTNAAGEPVVTQGFAQFGGRLS